MVNLENSWRQLISIDPKDINKRIKDVVKFVSGADELLQRQL